MMKEELVLFFFIFSQRFLAFPSYFQSFLVLTKHSVNIYKPELLNLYDNQLCIMAHLILLIFCVVSSISKYFICFFQIICTIIRYKKAPLIIACQSSTKSFRPINLIKFSLPIPSNPNFRRSLESIIYLSISYNITIFLSIFENSSVTCHPNSPKNC